MPSEHWRVVYAGKHLTEDKSLQECGIRPDTTLHLVGQLLGGKGGFGSLLRGAGRAILTDNVDACRDLSGRRLRQANAEKRLAEWAAEAKERELEKIALKHLKEQQKATQKEERAQASHPLCFHHLTTFPCLAVACCLLAAVLLHVNSTMRVHAEMSGWPILSLKTICIHL